MDTRSYAFGLAIIGLLVASSTALALSPASERTVVSEVLDDDAAQSGDAVSYDELPRPVQSAVDEVIREEYATFSTYDDHAAVEALPRTVSVKKNDEVYHIRTASADGSSDLFEGLARNILLGVGGLLVGGAIYLGVGKGRSPALAVLPIAATAAVLGTNVLAAPHPSEVFWLSDTSFGIALAVPILVGIALHGRDVRVAAAAVGTLFLSLGVLFLGDRLSLLPIMVGLVVLGIPGAVFGAWLEKVSTNSAPSTA